ncbi:hypothetical protein EVAR_4709_1 [Eumeta japonica]|uniref:Uncharacterized protein n=1 Tax=Eumeta variegata TaxID=151549 RepID=A0A4C1WLU3_EUMVA|nr:hypothetical protein EVAR_4709_1 [Eumeta japonica]
MNTRSYSSRGPLTCAQNRSGASAANGEARCDRPFRHPRLSSPLARECKLHIKFVSIDEYEYIEFVSKPRIQEEEPRRTYLSEDSDIDKNFVMEVKQLQMVWKTWIVMLAHLLPVPISQGRGITTAKINSSGVDRNQLEMCVHKGITSFSLKSSTTYKRQQSGHKPEAGAVGPAGWGPAGKRHLDYNAQSDTGSLKDLQQ